MTLCHNPWFSGKCILKGNYLLEGLIFHWTKILRGRVGKRKKRMQKEFSQFGEAKKNGRNCDFSVPRVGGNGWQGEKSLPTSWFLLVKVNSKKIPGQAASLLKTDSCSLQSWFLQIWKYTGIFTPRFAIQFFAIQNPWQRTWENPHPLGNHSEQH